MPYKYNWKDEQNSKEMFLPNVEGWGDTTIQYCYIMQENGEILMAWRIKDIDHTFLEYENVIKKYETPGKYFRENLKAFRTQLLEWAKLIKEDKDEEWMGEYIQLFKHHVE